MLPPINPPSADDQPAELKLKPIHSRIRKLLALAERYPRRVDELTGHAAILHQTHVAPLYGFLTWLDSYLHRFAAHDGSESETEIAALEALQLDLQALDDLLAGHRDLADLPTRRRKVEKIVRQHQEERAKRITAEAECTRLRQEFDRLQAANPDTP